MNVDCLFKRARVFQQMAALARSVGAPEMEQPEAPVPAALFKPSFEPAGEVMQQGRA